LRYLPAPLLACGVRSSTATASSGGGGEGEEGGEKQVKPSKHEATMGGAGVKDKVRARGHFPSRFHAGWGKWLATSAKVPIV
jgi:hypothetical protein